MFAYHGTGNQCHKATLHMPSATKAQLRQRNVFKENIKYKLLTVVTQSPTQKEAVSSAHHCYFCKGVFSLSGEVLMEKFLPKPFRF